MFRGGKVIDSRGTGITSGLMDGGRVGYQNAGVVTGGSLLDKAKGLFLGPYFTDPNFKAPSIAVPKGGGFEFLSPKSQFPRDSVEDLIAKEEGETIDELGFKKQPPVKYSPAEERAMKASDLEMGEGDLNLTEKDREGLRDFYKTLDIKDKVGEYKGGVPDKTTTEIPQQIDPDGIKGNQEQTTEIDPRELMKENVALFKEFLGEGNEKKLKDARIQDASDYLLKFFEGSQREGATVGSAAADVAAFATARDSRTEKAKAAIDKQDQTAVALAINDYVAGKRSKEQLDMLIAKSDLALSNKKAALDYANKLTQGFSALPGFIADSKAIGYAGRVVDGLRKSGLSKFPMEKVTSKEMTEQFEFDPETDTGKIFIETDTKTTYTLVPDGAGGYKKNIIDKG